MDLPGVHTPTAARTGRPFRQSHGIGELRSQVARGSRVALAGPVHEVMKQGAGAKTGGLQTSTLAVGLARAAIEFIEGETGKREVARRTSRQRSGRGSTVARSVTARNGRAATWYVPARNCEFAPTASRCEPRKRPSSPPREPASSSAIPPAAGAAKRCSFSFGVALSRVLAANLCELAGLGA